MADDPAEPGVMAAAVETTLAAVDLPPRLAAAAALARYYAAAIDEDPATLPKLGPMLFNALGVLGTTQPAPAAPPAGGAVPDVAGPTPRQALDELRAAAAARRARRSA